MAQLMIEKFLDDLTDEQMGYFASFVNSLSSGQTAAVSSAVMAGEIKIFNIPKILKAITKATTNAKKEESK